MIRYTCNRDIRVQAVVEVGACYIWVCEFMQCSFDSIGALIFGQFEIHHREISLVLLRTHLSVRYYKLMDCTFLNR